MTATSEPVWIGTSWKMNKTVPEAVAFIDRLAEVSIAPGVQPFVLPAHTAIAAVRARLPLESPVLLGVQNAHWAPEGAWTGEISMRMAADVGARLVELGHSERREHFGETDETVAAKVRAALDHHLLPLICVGESATVRDAGHAESFVADQARSALALVAPSEVESCLIAYEPVWAIGEHGRTATAAETSPVMAGIIAAVAELSGGGRLQALLYGGSVDLGNAPPLLADPHTNGLFVGRAAWQVEGFLSLLELASERAEMNAYSQN